MKKTMLTDKERLENYLKLTDLDKFNNAVEYWEKKEKTLYEDNVILVLIESKPTTPTGVLRPDRAIDDDIVKGNISEGVVISGSNVGHQKIDIEEGRIVEFREGEILKQTKIDLKENYSMIGSCLVMVDLSSVYTVSRNKIGK